MNKRFLISVLTVVAFLGTSAITRVDAAPQGGAPQPRLDVRPNPPDMTGVWAPVGLRDISKVLAPGEEIVLTPYGQERLKTVDQANDPQARCLPFGPIRAVLGTIHPSMIVQHPSVVVFLTESQHTYRLIYTDGRSHPADIEDYPDWYGSSIGKWEGDTLVVETIGIDDRTWLDGGHEHSIKLRLIERWRMVGPDSLQWTVTYEDPVFFVKPFTTTLTLHRAIGDRIMSHSCVENEIDSKHLVPTVVGVE